MTVSRQARSEYARKAGRAVGRVQAAIRSGKLVREPCVDCGASRVQAHHHSGYDPAHALDVEWVCRRHHLQRHGKVQRRSWERPGQVRAYLAATGRDPSSEKAYAYSETTGPRMILRHIERLWGFLRTDEERQAARDLIASLEGDAK